MLELTTIWAGIIAMAVFLYVLLDGFDLGIGVLFVWFQTPKERALMLSSIIPIWDGNQTWLVFGGATLYGAFPGAFSALLPAIYMPMILMVIFLLFRGISLEFRLKSKKLTRLWEQVFALSSLLASTCQGLILGTYVTGFGDKLPSYVNVLALNWLTPFSLFCAIGLVCGYVHLGACWLILKTSGALQAKAYRYAQYSLVGVVVILSLYCLYIPLISPIHYSRWFGFEQTLALVALPLASCASIVAGFFVLNRRYERLPFIFAMCLFISAALGVIKTIYPYIVPHAMTLSEAGASEASLRFMLYGAAIMLPILGAYTAHAHYVFRGKTHHIIAY